jgi:hypothetical protein
MSFRKLIEESDKQIREDIGEYYFISKSRIENLFICVEQGAKRIAELSKIIDEQQQEIKNLVKAQEAVMEGE